MTQPQQQQQSLADRVLAHVKLFEGYTASYYQAALGITREQFHSVARRCLQVYVSPSRCWTYYLKNSDKYPQS